MNRNEKKVNIETLREHFNNAGSVVITHYMGLTVEQVTKLRKAANKAETTFVVVKNRLAKIAAKETPYESLSDKFVGPTAIAFSKDAVTAAKLIDEFAKDNEQLVIQCGSIAGQNLDVNGVKSLAKLPSLNELRAKLVGMLNTPAQRIVGVLQAPARQVAGVTGAYSRKTEEAGA